MMMHNTSSNRSISNSSSSTLAVTPTPSATSLHRKQAGAVLQGAVLLGGLVALESLLYLLSRNSIGVLLALVQTI